MTRVLPLHSIFLLALAFLQPLTQLAAQEKSTSADSIERFAATWEGKCQDGTTFVVLTLQANGSHIDGSVSIGNMNGNHAGGCVSVLEPPTPEHAQKITHATVQQGALLFNGAKRADGSLARFELKQIDANTAQLMLLGTPVEEHPWQMQRAQKPQ